MSENTPNGKVSTEVWGWISVNKAQYNQELWRIIQRARAQKKDTMSMSNSEQFKDEYRAVIKKKIRSLQNQGTVAMSADNLWSITTGGIVRECPHAPVGVNCAYYARQTFEEIISEESIKYFIITPEYYERAKQHAAVMREAIDGLHKEYGI